MSSNKTNLRIKFLWNILNVLAVPITITILTIWFSATQSQATIAASQQQHQTDMNIAQDQQEETALQTYLDRMSDLLLNSHLN